MRVLVVLAAALALAAGAAARPAAEESTTAKPALRLLSKAPVKFRGLSFKSRERVRVRVVVEDTAHVRLTTASVQGTFAVTFASLSVLDPCDLDATATGSRGSRAAFQLSERFCPVP